MDYSGHLYPEQLKDSYISLFKQAENLSNCCLYYSTLSKLLDIKIAKTQ